MTSHRRESLASASEDARVRAAFVLCAALSLFQMYTAGVALLQTPVQRSIHLGFVLSIVFLLYPLNGGRYAKWTDNLCIACSIAGTGYVALFADAIALRGGDALPYEIVLGCVTMAVLLEAGRRVLGRTLPALGGLFLLYCLYGRYAPSIFAHRGYSVKRVVQHMYLTTEGIFGVALGVSSTFIFMFILFGAFLSGGGGARLFNNLALALTGRSPGGPAKVAIVASGLLGTINGSSVANVATTGAFTIPMMKKSGYSAEDAAAVEACASTGGQLMPPIMGAGAFIMSEFLNIPYLEIVKSALIPALLYYGALFLNVHLKARKENLKGAAEGLPQFADVIREDGHLLLPLLLIVVMLMRFYTPLKSAFWAIIAMVAVCALKRHTRMAPAAILRTMADGAQAAIGTAVACAVIGFVVGGSSLTALGLTLSGNIVKMAGGLLLPTLILAMAACFLLGMGLPTTANYIVTSTVVVPALTKLGIPGISAHMFVFYFGIMADISPPVCLASFTAAGIAGGDATRTGIKALLLALGLYLMPYMFIYSPEVLLQQGTLWHTSRAVLSAACGMAALAAAVQGWWFRTLSPLFRGAFLVAGLLCFFPDWRFMALGAGISLVLALGCYLVNTKREMFALKKMLFVVAAVLLGLGAQVCFAADEAKAPGNPVVASNARFYTLRLLPGADVIAEMRDFINKNKIQAAAIVSSVGSLSEANIRFANRSEGTLMKGAYEVIFFGGTLDAAGQHLHLSIADGDGKMLGGHMLKGCITRTTMEIVVMELTNVVYKREKCPVSTYDELVVYPKN